MELHALLRSLPGGVLPPGVSAETRTFRNGESRTVYRCPFFSEGPVRGYVDGREAWLFMYGHFVFVWPLGAGQLQVRHGTLRHSIPLFDDVPITGTCEANTLREFGITWTRDHLARFISRPHSGHRRREY
ncbi:hypothetical protein GCM10012275_39040 [Longimycelium tulufanense]|uniref:Uncharacterized protein n=1 Tax=Longimycelium tulufanense TaxID=907463 RepID=A0A8J3CA99_9PSEU|nr:hypothetical protein GCM10012275_39040 [Longimycelium tulufanense]